MMTNSSLKRLLQVALLSVLLVAVSVVMANFAADIVYGLLDPRVRA